MPEGDTVHKLAAALGREMAGAVVTGGRLADRPGVALAGRRIEAVQARGKHLFLEFEDGALLRSHLGLHGSWHRYRLGEAWRRPAREAAIELEFDQVLFVCFNPREVEWTRRGGLRHREVVGRLGPDLLGNEPDYEIILDRARRLHAPDSLVVDLLLDQRVASGIGNVYGSEILFLERTDPRRRLGDLDRSRITRLFVRARSLLSGNLGDAPRRTRPLDDEMGNLWVYRRQGRPCFLCGEPIRHARMGRGWRSTYWCPRCQT